MRHRPALVLATGAVVIAVAGGLTGAALASGHDEHGWGERGRHVEHDDTAPGPP